MSRDIFNNDLTKTDSFGTRVLTGYQKSIVANPDLPKNCLNVECPSNRGEEILCPCCSCLTNKPTCHICEYQFGKRIKQ